MKWRLRPINEIGQYTDMQVGGREGGGSGRSKPKIVAAIKLWPHSWRVAYTDLVRGYLVAGSD
jgi:hypothetical protein